jgi:hypothetical protein
MPQPKVLFVLKKRHNYNLSDGSQEIKSSGLFNSARFVADMLVAAGMDVTMVQVNDNNDIDREVTHHKPNVVIIEALWVVPEKFDVLKKLHPHVKWVVRLHSEIPFLANEGSALGWIHGYAARGVFVGFNSYQTLKDFTDTVSPDDVDWAVYMPNYYPLGKTVQPYKLKFKDTVDVGCFGAVRPMKNQLIQAFAAVKWARMEGLRLRFHINGTRVDNKDTLPVLKNLREYFAGLGPEYVLHEHPWYEHDEFLQVIAKMDIGLQVSFTETFNIVAANFASEDVPIVVSPEIDWIPEMFQAEPTDVNSIVTAMTRALEFKKNFRKKNPARDSLRQMNDHARVSWIHTISALLPAPPKKGRK